MRNTEQKQVNKIFCLLIATISFEQRQFTMFIERFLYLAIPEVATATCVHLMKIVIFENCNKCGCFRVNFITNIPRIHWLTKHFEFDFDQSKLKPKIIIYHDEIV